MGPRGACPCHSGLPYGRCCRPYHRGEALPVPDALMRSRYAAYALGKVRYIQETGEDRDDRDVWAEEIRRFCAQVSFVGLAILSVEPGDEVAYVTFRAELQAAGHDVGFSERSRFELRDRWRYVAGERL